MKKILPSLAVGFVVAFPSLLTSPVLAAEGQSQTPSPEPLGPGNLRIDEANSQYLLQLDVAELPADAAQGPSQVLWQAGEPAKVVDQGAALAEPVSEVEPDHGAQLPAGGPQAPSGSQQAGPKGLDQAWSVSVRQPAEQGAVFDGSGSASAAEKSFLRSLFDEVKIRFAVHRAQKAFYRLTKGSVHSGQADAAQISVEALARFYRSPEFIRAIKAIKAAGQTPFRLTDFDKTLAAGDVFTYFFKWRAENGKITPHQNEVMVAYLKTLKVADPALANELAAAGQNDGAANGRLVIKLWRAGAISLLDFWRNVYWPTQIGLTKEEKREQSAAFAATYGSYIYKSVADMNRALHDAGATAVLVSNGDEEPLKALAPLVGVNPENVVGSNLIYDANGLATGVEHSYEISDPAYVDRPQEGKMLAFHYWLNENKGRFGWSQMDEEKTAIVGMIGDTASADGGPMFINPPNSRAFNFFMANTPQESGRIQKFYILARKYLWTKGRLVTVNYSPENPTAWDDQAPETAVPFSSGGSKALTPRVEYDVTHSGGWKGHVIVFAAKKKDLNADGTPYTSGQYLTDLKSHVENVKNVFGPLGLVGYLVYPTVDAELAVMEWESQEKMDQAFKLDAVKTVAAESARMFVSQPPVLEALTSFSGKLTSDFLRTYLSRLAP